MKTVINAIMLSFFGLSLSCAQTQEQHEHETHHASLDAHLAHVQQVKDPVERKKMLRMHIQMMKEKMEAMAPMEHGGMMSGGMDHGEGGMGGGMGGMDHGEGGMGGGMMQHHNLMVNMMQNMISVQEMLLDMIDK